MAWLFPFLVCFQISFQLLLCRASGGRLRCLKEEGRGSWQLGVWVKTIPLMVSWSTSL